MGNNRTIILDGGMGRQLARIGAPFRMPEWSALALIEAPDLVERAHAQFIAGGAEVITTNSYSILPHQIGKDYFKSNGCRLADLAGRLARSAADKAGRKVKVAGSIPPPFGSYQPNKFDADCAPAILDILIMGLAQHVDVWLIETQSSTAEAHTALKAAARFPRPIWVSYTLKDEAGRTEPAELRSGEPVADAVRATVQWGAQAVLFNCSQPEVMAAAVSAGVEALRAIGRGDVRIGVYANTFEPEPPSDAAYAGISEMRADVSPQRYLAFVEQWLASGASIVGGCCGIGPEHIAEIAEYLRSTATQPKRVAIPSHEELQHDVCVVCRA